MSKVTKRALEQSLKNLLLKKPLTKITIGDITEDCGINRMTFYYHFKDIYDLVEWACLEDARRALDEKKTYDTWQQGLLQIFAAVQENKPFILNVYRCVHREQVEKYLYSRGIHPVIIRHCVENKLLFESADYHSAVFMGYDKDGKARYGALRSTVSSYKGELTGSDKHFSFFLEGKPNAEHIHVFESAIDLLSFATLTLLAGRDWKSETYLSLAGVFQTKRENVVPVALSRFLGEHPSVRKIHLHLDNDAVGRGAVKGIVGGLQGKYQVYDEPPAHGKDVNDELKIRVGLMRERKERERT